MGDDARCSNHRVADRHQQHVADTERQFLQTDDLRRPRSGGIREKRNRSTKRGNSDRIEPIGVPLCVPEVVRVRLS
jgi:hypothetical protein